MVNEYELNDIKPETIADREKKGFYTIIGEYNVFMFMKTDAIIYHDQEYKIIKSVRYEDIISIKEKDSYSKHDIVRWGVIGLAAGRRYKTVDLSYNDGTTKEELVLKDINKEEAINFVNAVKNKINKEKIVETSNPFDRIKDAKSLLDMGAISESEYQVIKDKYLKKL
jgi:hypothetical protein